MALISEQEKAVLKRRFRKKLVKDVLLKLFISFPSPLILPGRECPTCPETERLLRELTELSSRLHLEVSDFFSDVEGRELHGVERIPAIVMDSEQGARLRFYGIPVGYEFETLVKAIETLSRGVSPLALETRKELRKVNQPVHMQVFVTPSGRHCQMFARLAHAMALQNPLITSDVIQIQEFPNLARQYNVTAVPKTVINNIVEFGGNLSENQIVDKVLQVGLR